MTKLSDECKALMGEFFNAADWAKTMGFSQGDVDVSLAKAIYQAGTKAGFADKFSEFYMNSLLSGMGTVAVNAASGAVQAVVNVPVRALEAAMGTGLRAVGSVIGKKDLGKNFAYWGEFGPMFAGMFQASSEAMMLGARAWKSGMPLDELMRTRGRQMSSETYARTHAIGGKIGEWVRSPSKFNAMMDEGWRAMFRRSQANALLYRAAVRAKEDPKFQGKTVNDIYKELQKNIFDVEDGKYWFSRLKDSKNEADKQLFEELRLYGQEMTFQQDLPKFLGTLQRGLAAKPIAKLLIAPFVKTPVNIAREGLEYIPGSVVYRWGQSFNDRMRVARGMMKEEDVRTVDPTLYARNLFGLGAMAYTHHLIDEGIITGSKPNDRAARETRDALQIPEYSINVGKLLGGEDKWLEYGKLEPISTFLGLMADFWGGMKERGVTREKLMMSLQGKGLTEDQIKDIIDSQTIDVHTIIAQSFVQNLVNKTFLKQVQTIVDVAFDPDATADVAIQSWIANGFVPSLFGQAARAFDPYERELSADTFVEGTLNRMQNRMPGLRQQLPIKTDILGQPSKQTNRFPFYPSGGVQDDNAQFLQQIGFEKSRPDKTIKGLKVSGEEYAALQAEVGSFIDQRFMPIVEQLRDRNDLSDDKKRVYLEKVYNKIRSAAENKFFAQMIQDPARRAEYIAHRQRKGGV